MKEIQGISAEDLDWWHDKIVALDWVFAVTYADGAPHEYVSEKTEGMTRSDFERAARVIHTFGEPQKFFKTTRIYLVHSGWKYWTMDRDHSDVNLINMGRDDHVYGVQNAPRTASEEHSDYDTIPTFWDEHFGLSEQERDGFMRVIADVTGGYKKFRTLDIGAGTGPALDLEITEPWRLTAVDPSQAMLNELVRKHPLVARVEPMSFERLRAAQNLCGTKFDLVLALGGSASYLTRADWLSLPNHAKGRYVLSVYAEEEPESARKHMREFAALHGGEIERVGRFEVCSVKP